MYFDFGLDIQYNVDAYQDSESNVSIVRDLNAMVSRMEATDPALIFIEDDEYSLSGFVSCEYRSTTEICYIQCIGLAQCYGTTLEVTLSERTANLKELNIICHGVHACTEDMAVDVIDTDIERFTLLCYGMSVAKCDSLSCPLPNT